LLMHKFVEALQEVDRFQILAAAKAVRNPFALLARVVQVQHGGYGVHTQPVDMELSQPIQRVRQQEIANFVAAVIENERAPFAMLALPRIGVLVKRGPVEAPKAVRVAWKM